MSTLYFGFCGEGVRDYGFLRPIVTKTLQKFLPHVDIFPHDLEPPNGTQKEKLGWILSQGYQLTIIHLDADGRDYEKALEERFNMVYALDEKEAERIVPVVPVKNTDAWMLVDFDAFKKVIGTNATKSDLGFPERPHQVETLPDPKLTFENAVRDARSGRRRKLSPEKVYIPLASKIEIALLEQVPAYQVFQRRLENSLQKLHLF